MPLDAAATSQEKSSGVSITAILLKNKEAFNPEVFAKAEAKMRRQKLARLQKLAASLNYQLVPSQCLVRLVSQEAASPFALSGAGPRKDRR